MFGFVLAGLASVGATCQPCQDAQDCANGDACVRGRCVPSTAVTCEYEGQTYREGDRFPSADGCNECFCAAQGQVACTERACANCEADACGAPPAPVRCADGLIPEPSCERDTDARCAWQVPECTVYPSCGGIAGIGCASGRVCVDDRSDSCDPAAGGRDCGGICVPNRQVCGDAICGAGTECCNASCGICTEPGGACIQVACESAE